MALPANYRIVAVNNTGISIDTGLIAAAVQPYSGDGAGALTHGNEQTGSTGASLADGSSATLLTVSGSTDVGLVGEAEANLSGNGTGGASGDVEFYLETSTDGGSNWNRPPTPVAVIFFTGSNSDKSTSFSV